ncbi:hypothetical protein [Domibacillus epiphyticus]|nr:hypothetical protein [Domibacillus epiphyticus]
MKKAARFGNLTVKGLEELWVVTEHYQYGTVEQNLYILIQKLY